MARLLFAAVRDTLNELLMNPKYLGAQSAFLLALHTWGRSLVLHPHIPNIQASWVKLGAEGVRWCLSAGVNDLGGTLMDETISRSAGASHGQEMTPQAMEAIIRSADRLSRQRTTLYATANDSLRDRSFAAADVDRAAAADATRAH